MEKLVEFNGEIVSFPDSMSDEEIEKVLSQQSSTEEPKQSSLSTPFKNSLALQGLVGLGDAAKTIGSSALGNLAGGLAGAGRLMTQSPFTPTDVAMGKAAETMEGVQDRFTLPPSTTQGQKVIGGIAPYAQKIDTGLTDLFDKVPGGAGTKAAARTAVQGPLEILGLRGVGQVAKSALPAKATSFVPEIDDLFNVGRVAFDQARINGSGIKPEAISRAFDSVSNMKTKSGLRLDFDPDLHPASYALKQRFLRDLSEGDVSFDEMMTLRELAGDVAGSQVPAESMRGMKIKNAIDDFIDGLSPDDVVSGDPAKAANALNTARSVWRDASAGKTIEQQMRLAEVDAGDTTGAGFENKVRIRFRQLARRIEQGKERGFTPKEVALIKQVAEGTPIGNVFRQFGKFSPTGVVSTAATMGIGNFLGGPLGVGAAMGAGLLGRHLATKATMNSARQAMQAPLKRSLIDP